MLTVFSFTNGRSTHKYSVDSLCGVDYVLLKDQEYKTALETCVNTCQTAFFLRLDDDMFLHPKALDYMIKVITQLKNVGMFIWYLWEDYTQTIRQAIKVYRTEAMKRIGGFKFLPSGKTDMATLCALRNARWKIHEDNSILAIHARGTVEETIRYYNLWSKKSETYKKQGYEESLQYTKSVEYQYSLRNNFLMDLNVKEGTPFAKYYFSTP